MITFNLISENRPCIEGWSDKEDSFFANQYYTAFRQIDSYLWNLHNGDRTGVDSYTDENNNVFAFIGARGSGKTSCMLSVANMLVDQDGMDDEDKQLYAKIHDSHFETIGLIDPTYLEAQRNIVAIFLGKLFQQFKQIRGIEDKDARAKLLECFSKAQTCVTELQKDKKALSEEDELDQLVNYAAASNLKNTINDLVKQYLKYKGHADGYLLLLIDDIDLNSKEAGKMADFIQRYFINKHILVLMSLKMDQLENIKRMEYMSEYSMLIANGSLKEGEIDDMVERYLTKLMPHAQRVFMPTSESYLKMPFAVVYQKGNQQGRKKYYSIEQAIPQLIFEKTRYLFYNSALHSSYIVPRNLRELRQLLSLLFQMPEYSRRLEAQNLKKEQLEEQDKKEISNKWNKAQFCKYFYENWVINNLNVRQREIIREVRAVEDNSELNISVIRALKKYYPELQEIENSANQEKTRGGNTELAYILKSDNIAYKISLGDVVALLDYLNTNQVEEGGRKFLFSIKTIYSMRLYDAYDAITERFYESAKMRERKNKKEKRLYVKVGESLQNLNEYERLVNGHIFNSELTPLLPLHLGEYSLLYRNIKLKALEDEVVKILDEDWNVEDNAFVARLNLLEFIILCLSAKITRYQNIPNGSQFGRDVDYRLEQNVSSNEELSSTSVLFDISSMFYNIQRWDKQFARIKRGKMFLRKIQNDALNCSLYGKCGAKAQKRYQHLVSGCTLQNSHAWLSHCTIRNMELLLDFLNYSKMPTANISDDRMALSRLYSRMSSYRIKTYDLKENGRTFYSIQFDFLKEISKALANPTIASLYSNIIVLTSERSEAFGTEQQVNNEQLGDNEGKNQ